ncbi:MAG: type II toxin-antitoxin system RelE/ParE family toxin [Magnetococcales bacterium]|nr:type II toxin-antitoxin system RelE/ParE family toxin [Magnetococcales bacterium]
MPYSVIWDRVALRQLRRLDAEIQRRILQKVLNLESNPRPPGVLRLEGTSDTWRIRAGNYRVLPTNPAPDASTPVTVTRTS